MKPFARINLSSVLSSVALAKGEALAKGDALRTGILVSSLALAAGCEPVPFATDDYAVEKGTVYFQIGRASCRERV